MYWLFINESAHKITLKIITGYLLWTLLNRVYKFIRKNKKP